MLGTLAAMFIAVWYFMTARKVGRDPISWTLAGLLVYFVLALSWTWIVTPGIKDAATHTQNGVLIAITRYAYILVGLAGAVFYNLKFSKAKQQD